MWPCIILVVAAIIFSVVSFIKQYNEKKRNGYEGKMYFRIGLAILIVAFIGVYICLVIREWDPYHGGPSPTPTEELATPFPTYYWSPKPTTYITPEPTRKPTPEPTPEPTFEPVWIPDPTRTPRPTATPKPTASPKPTATPLPSGYYGEGQYKVGIDIPAGEYVVFAEKEYGGYFSVTSDANGDDIICNSNFEYNSIISIKSGNYFELSRAYARPLSSNPYINTTGEGMFKIGLHLPAGEYKVVPTSSYGGYYCIWDSSYQEDIIANENFDGQSYVAVKNGQYLELSGCKIVH